MVKRLRVLAGSMFVDNAFRLAARVGGWHPRARPERHDVERQQDVAYGPRRPEHLLDVYRPLRGSSPHPALLYVHGGGFRILSKDTHWIMALAYARAGYVVFNVNYRLAPRSPYPAALEDVSRAYAWVVANAARFGADASRLVVAGESAGANLATSLTIAACTERLEPFARDVFQTGNVPVAVVPACGIFQVSDPGRFARRKALPAFVADRIHEVSHAYLAGADASAPGGTELADPLLVLEGDTAFARPLPPFYTAVGTRDPLLSDTRRLKAALDRRGVRCDVRYFPGELHAFQAAVWRPNAVQFWKESLAFLREHTAPRDRRAA